MSTPSRAGLCWLACLATLFALVGCPVALAGPLEKFTGYTRIGHPVTVGDGKKEKPAELDEQKAIGVTIYFMVLDRKTGRKGKIGDTWGVGIQDFDSHFVSGRDNDVEKLDAEARYLYLYQIVNDREGTRAAVKDVTVRLIVDPRLITSWGHFRIREEGKEKAPVKGAGFTMEFLDLKQKEEKYVIRPLSSLFPGISDRRYQNPAPAVLAPRPYGVTSIDVGKVKQAADEADVGKAPEDVLLVPNADFGAPPKSDSVYLAPARSSDLDDLPDSEDLDARRRMRELLRNRWPAIRAFFRDPDNQIKPRQRSTIFGFTCDLPPTLETVAVGGRGGGGIGLTRLEPLVPPDRFVIAGPDDARRTMQKQRAEKGGATLPPISGTLPTPAHPKKPRAQARAEPKGGLSPSPLAQTGTPNLPGSLGGVARASGSSGGGLLAGTGGFGSGSGGLGGGGSAGGGGGSSAAVSPTQATTPQASQATVTVENRNLAVASTTQARSQAQAQTQGQAQVQAQAQRQEQAQGQGQNHTPPANVVAAPPAWLLGLLGLPVLYLFARGTRPADKKEGR